MTETGQAASPGKLRLVAFGLIPVGVLLVALEITGRMLYAFDADARAERMVKRDFRVKLSYFGGQADARTILRDVNRLQPRYLPFLGYLAPPNLNFPTIRTNELGFRTGPLEPRQPGEFRVLLLGGSVAWGLGASSNEATPAAALERLLNKGGGKTRFRVMNGAYIAYTARQELVVLMTFLNEFDPDLVISLTGYNDVLSIVHDIDGLLQRPEARTLAKAVDDQLRPMGTLESVRKVAGTLGIWRLVVYLREVLPSGAPAGGEIRYDEAKMAKAVPRVIDMYQTMAEYALRHGRRYAVALQPDIYTTGKPMSAEELQAKALYAEQVKGQDVTQAYTRYRQGLERGLASLPPGRIPVLDLRGVFDKSPAPVFIDDAHVNDAGYEAMAEELRRWIVSTLIP